MPSYSPKAIERLSGALLAAAGLLLYVAAILGLVVGYVAGEAVSPENAVVWAVLGAVVSAVGAYPASLVIRAIAQLLLSQVEIERHARAVADTSRAAGSKSDSSRGGSAESAPLPPAPGPADAHAATNERWVPPAELASAYEQWKQTLKEHDYKAFLSIAQSSSGRLLAGASEAQLEEAFPDIPIDFGSLLRR